MTQTSTSANGDEAAARALQERLGGAPLPGQVATRERNLLRLGGALLVVGPLWVGVAYFVSHAASSSLQQNDALVAALFGCCLAIVGAALFLRYSVGRFLRFWLARLSYEQEAQAARLAEVVDAAGRRQVS
jgi:hypothetical protein